MGRFRGMVLATGLTLSALAGGCAGVRPWQREELARVDEVLSRDASARAWEAHMWMVRESALGGSGKAGGGCGCN